MTDSMVVSWPRDRWDLASHIWMDGGIPSSSTSSFQRFICVQLDQDVVDKRLIVNAVKARLFNMQNKRLSKRVAQQHYDLDNDFYEKMLDPHMQYTCAYWKGVHTLAEAQEQKLELICRKLQLRKGDRILELGCGWGGFAQYAATKYGCSVVAYNISSEQVAYARRWCAGLPVEVIQGDYREATGEFDKVAAIGLCEHVGYKNYRTLMETVHRTLKPRGLFLLHTIGNNASVTTSDPWFDKYIFPGGMLPSVAQLSAAMDGLFVMEDWHNFGPDYDRTLMAWQDNRGPALGGIEVEVRRALPSDVALLSAVSRRGIPRQENPSLAGGDVKAWHPGRV